MKAGLFLSALLVIATPVLAKDNKPEHMYGPPPKWKQYRILAEAEITQRLLDPESARIEWLGQYHKGGFKPLLQARAEGYVGCGTVNARNRMGGYAGRTSFVVVIDYDRVLFADIDSRPNGLIADNCSAASRAGLLPPLPAGTMTADVTPGGIGHEAQEAPATGLSLRVMPEGAYISAVGDGSPASVAGLRPGMVIASVNTIPLAGMGDTMVKIIGAAGPNALLALVGGKTIQLKKPPMKRIVLAALIMGIGAPLQAKTDYVYGPAPDWERYKALGEAAIRSKLPDPANWAIEWPNGYAQLVWFHKGRFPGYVTCGVLRSLVPVKDRNQIVNFAVSIDHDQVKIADISQRPSNSLVNIICQDIVQRGKIPPARLMDAPPDVVVEATGLTIRVMPEGAYIVAATAGGSGQRAGLTSGMVITRANGIALGGLGMSMATILGSDVAALTLETAAGGHFIVKRAP